MIWAAPSQLQSWVFCFFKPLTSSRSKALIFEGSAWQLPRFLLKANLASSATNEPKPFPQRTCVLHPFRLVPERVAKLVCVKSLLSLPGSKNQLQWGSAELVSSFDLQCAVFVGPVRESKLLKLGSSFRCAGAMFRELLYLRCKCNAIRVSGVFVLRRSAWNARALVCSSSVFFRPLIQSAPFDVLQKSTLLAHSFRSIWGKVSRSCCAARVARMKSEHTARFGRVKSLSLWRGVRFFKMQSEPSARFGRVASQPLWRGARVENAKRMQNEPPAHFGRVKSFLLRRGAHFENAK